MEELLQNAIIDIKSSLKLQFGKEYDEESPLSEDEINYILSKANRTTISLKYRNQFSNILTIARYFVFVLKIIQDKPIIIDDLTTLEDIPIELTFIDECLPIVTIINVDNNTSLNLNYNIEKDEEGNVKNITYVLCGIQGAKLNINKEMIKYLLSNELPTQINENDKVISLNGYEIIIRPN